MTKSLVIAVIGLGSIGMRHVDSLRRLGCSVVGFDPDAARIPELESKGGESAPSRDVALIAADGAIIASPTGEHLDDFATALEAGCDVLVEKPIAHVVEGVSDILRSADSAGRIVAVGYNLRFHPAACASRDALKNGRIGTVLWARFIGASYLPHWRPNQDYRNGYAADRVSGGALFDWSHELDLATSLLGSAKVAAAVGRRTGELEIAAEDCADVVLRHRGGVLSTLHLDYVTRPAQRRFEICGTDGFMMVDLLCRRMRIVDTQGAIVDEQIYAGSFDDDYVSEAESFLQSIRTRHAARCSGWDGLTALEHALTARSLLGLAATS